MATALNEATRRLVDDPNFAVVATINPDGSPQQSVVWVKREGDHVLFTTTEHRRKGRNLGRDPRVGILIVDPGDPYRYVEIRGRAQLTPDPDNALGNELSHKYLGEDAPEEPDWVRRVAVRVVVDKLTGPVAAG
jgi:PPOX class probable F420-dependent enzyme